MPKYQVKILEVHATIVEVDADNEQDAQGKAEDLLSVGCYPSGQDLPEGTYDYTLERDEWPVWEA